MSKITRRGSIDIDGESLVILAFILGPLVLIGMAIVFDNDKDETPKEPTAVVETVEAQPSRTQELQSLLEAYNALPEHDPLRRDLRTKINLLTEQIIQEATNE